MFQRFSHFFFLPHFGSPRGRDFSPGDSENFSSAQYFSHHRLTVPAHDKFKWRMLCVFTKQMCRTNDKHAPYSFARSFTYQPFCTSFVFIINAHSIHTICMHLKFIRQFIFWGGLFNFRRITMSISNQSSDKREAYDDGLQDLGVPMSVQTFLWGQIAPFIRPKLGKLHEAACQVREFISLMINLNSR